MKKAMKHHPIEQEGKIRGETPKVLFCIKLLAFTLCCLIPGFSHLRAQGVSLDYNQIDASGFPGIVSFLTVTDGAGLYVSGLTENDFEVREDSVRELPIVVEELTEDGEGITVALVLDRSGSMQGQPMQDAKQAASNFVQLLQDQDRAAVVSFNQFVTTDHAFSSDKNSLTAAISTLQAFGGTAIYDALISTADLIEPEQGRRAIILLTDGEDTNSQNSFQTALNRVTTVNVPVFTIGLALTPGSPEENILITIANDTGGRYFYSPTSSELQEIYEAIAAILRNQYKITYTTHNPTTDGSWRLVQIDVSYQGYTSNDTARYQAPDHVVTIAPTTTDQVSPGREFTLDIEIPPSSLYLFHQMKNLFVELRYNATYLDVKQVFDQNINAGALFGPPAEYSKTFDVDTTNGVISLNFSKLPGTALIEGRGKLAHITFEAASDMPDSTELHFDITDHLATDTNDWPIATRAENLTLYSYGMIVWPGDTNENGEVELTDVTVLGVYWNLNGEGRPTEPDPLAWRAQLAGHYPLRKTAHADADGNGSVSERDLVPIGLNWGKTTDSPDPVRTFLVTASTQPSGHLTAKISETQTAHVFRLSLSYELAPTDQLCGTTFRLRYPADKMEIAAVSPGKAWTAQPLFISSTEEKGVLAAGIMLTAGSPLLAESGDLAELLVRADTKPEPNELQFEQVALVTSDGILHEFEVENGDSGTTTPIPNAFVLQHAYPNPFNPSTALRYAMPEPGNVQVRVFNITGRLVRMETQEAVAAGEHSWHWFGQDQNGRQVSTGIYIVQMEAVGKSGKKWHAQQKITFTK